MYYRNFCSLVMIVFFGFSWIGCGAEVPSEPGEEVVSDKWIDPKDIGKEYSVDKVKTGDIVMLSTGETYQVRTFFRNENPEKIRNGVMVDAIEIAENGDQIITSHVFEPVPNEPNVLREKEYIPRGTVVPKGDPIVTLFRMYGTAATHITKDNNKLDYVGFSWRVTIDRVLDHNLPIYMEYQVRNIQGEVKRGRFLMVVPKGKTIAKGKIPTEDTLSNNIGRRNEHDKGLISILPYTEMKEITLPITLHDGLVIPKGHKFRPYRIRSSSFLMGEDTSLGDDW